MKTLKQHCDQTKLSDKDLMNRPITKIQQLEDGIGNVQSTFEIGIVIEEYRRARVTSTNKRTSFLSRMK